MGIFPSFKVQFDSPLSPAQVIERLNAGIKKPKSELAGTLTAHEFYLAPQDPGTVRGSFIGKLTPIATGTRLEGAVELHVGAQAFFGVIGISLTLVGMLLFSFTRQFMSLAGVGLVFMVWVFFSSIIHSDSQAIPALVKRVLEDDFRPPARS